MFEKPKKFLGSIFHRSASAQPQSVLHVAQPPDGPAPEQSKKEELKNSSSLTSGRDNLRAAWKLIKPYWFSEDKWKARGLLAAVVGLTLAQVYVNVQLNDWNTNFYDAIQNYNEPEFNRQLGVFTGWAGAYIGTVVYGNYLTQKLQMNWRKWMTGKSLDAWLDKKAYHDIQQNPDGKSDNPDQRISDDVDMFTSQSLGLSVGLINAGVSLASFSNVLWKMSTPLQFNIAAHSISIPGTLVWAALGYSILGSILTQKIGKKLPGLNYQQQKKEADFRFSAIRVRENAESIALYGGEDVEKKSLSNRFNRVVTNYWDIIKKQKQLTWFNSGFGQVGIIFPYVAMAHQYFSKTVKLGDFFRAASAFNYVQSSMSWFVNSFTQYASWKAATDRLTGFSGSIAKSNEKYEKKEKTLASPDGLTPAL